MGRAGLHLLASAHPRSLPHPPTPPSTHACIAIALACALLLAGAFPHTACTHHQHRSCWPCWRLCWRYTHVPTPQGITPAAASAAPAAHPRPSHPRASPGLHLGACASAPTTGHLRPRTTCPAPAPAPHGFSAPPTGRAGTQLLHTPRPHLQALPGLPSRLLAPGAHLPHRRNTSRCARIVSASLPASWHLAPGMPRCSFPAAAFSTPSRCPTAGATAPTTRSLHPHGHHHRAPAAQRSLQHLLTPVGLRTAQAQLHITPAHHPQGSCSAPTQPCWRLRPPTPGHSHTGRPGLPPPAGAARSPRATHATRHTPAPRNTAPGAQRLPLTFILPSHPLAAPARTPHQAMLALHLTQLGRQLGRLLRAHRFHARCAWSYAPPRGRPRPPFTTCSCSSSTTSTSTTAWPTSWPLQPAVFRPAHHQPFHLRATCAPPPPTRPTRPHFSPSRYASPCFLAPLCICDTIQDWIEVDFFTPSLSSRAPFLISPWPGPTSCLASLPHPPAAAPAPARSPPSHLPPRTAWYRQTFTRYSPAHCLAAAGPLPGRRLPFAGPLPGLCRACAWCPPGAHGAGPDPAGAFHLVLATWCSRWPTPVFSPHTHAARCAQRWPIPGAAHGAGAMPGFCWRCPRPGRPRSSIALATATALATADADAGAGAGHGLGNQAPRSRWPCCRWPRPGHLSTALALALTQLLHLVPPTARIERSAHPSTSTCSCSSLSP